MLYSANQQPNTNLSSTFTTTNMTQAETSNSSKEKTLFRNFTNNIPLEINGMSHCRRGDRTHDHVVPELLQSKNLMSLGEDSNGESDGNY